MNDESKLFYALMFIMWGFSLGGFLMSSAYGTLWAISGVGVSLLLYVNFRFDRLAKSIGDKK